MQIADDARQATVVVPDDQVSLAIGKNGQNVRLASKLTGYALALVKEGAEDIELIEFRQELGRELYDALINAGIDTSREFLEADPKVLLAMASLEKVLEVRGIMLDEFEEREDPRYVRELEAAAAEGTATQEPSEADDDIAESYAEDTPEVYVQDEEEGLEPGEEVAEEGAVDEEEG